MRRPRGRAQAGMTLVEIAFAIGILGILLAGVFASMASSMRVSVLTREHEAASEACARKLDEWATNPNNGVVFVDNADAEYFAVPMQSGAGSINLTPANPLPGGWTDGTRAGRVELDLDPLGFGNATGAGPDAVAIRVTVAWRQADGSNQQIEMVTVRGR